jgi:DNA/RNA endonuclease YhcR with UshA esterase domain
MMEDSKEFKGKIKYFALGLIAVAIVGFLFFSGYSQTKYVCSDGRTVDNPDLCVSTSNPQNSPSTETTSSTCYDYTEAKSHVGETICIKGKVVQVYTSAKSNTFLNFCSNYKTCPFSAVIFSSDKSKFSDVQMYSGKNVEITGLIRTYQGNAEIIINSPNQIKIK